MTSYLTFETDDCTVFCKTGDPWGEFSNMCKGFNLVVNDIHILTSEALYQAFRFPDHPDVQKVVIDEKSPMSAKMVGKPHIKQGKCRTDWDDVRVDIMRYCLRVKYAQHRNTFGKKLLESGDSVIVEYSHKDHFWGAVPVTKGSKTLEGHNTLGLLLMELRDEIKTLDKFVPCRVEPLDISNFKLYGNPVKRV